MGRYLVRGVHLERDKTLLSPPVESPQAWLGRAPWTHRQDQRGESGIIPPTCYPRGFQEAASQTEVYIMQQPAPQKAQQVDTRGGRGQRKAVPMLRTGRAMPASTADCHYHWRNHFTKPRATAAAGLIQGRGGTRCQAAPTGRCIAHTPVLTQGPHTGGAGVRVSDQPPEEKNIGGSSRRSHLQGTTDDCAPGPASRPDTGPAHSASVPPSARG